MKKLTFAVITVLAMSLLLVSIASAGKWGVDNQKASLYLANGSSDNVLGIVPQGKVMVNNPRGSSEMIVQGSATGLTAGKNYQVWIRDLEADATVEGPWLFAYPQNGYVKLTTFFADEFGNGSFNYHMPADTLTDGTYQIQVAINEDGVAANAIGTTYLATPWGGGPDGLTVVISSK